VARILEEPEEPGSFRMPAAVAVEAVQPERMEQGEREERRSTVEAAEAAEEVIAAASAEPLPRPRAAMGGPRRIRLLAEQAVAYRLKASLAVSAITEAVAQLRKGLDVLAGLPDSPWRQQQELDLQIALVSALSATKGWVTSDVDEAYARACALAEQGDRPERLLLLIAGQWAIYSSRAEHSLSLPLCNQLEQIGEARNDAVWQLAGRYTQGNSRFHLGEFVVARAVLERGIDLADPAYRTIGGLSVEPYAGMLAYLAVTLACQGYVDRRLRHHHTLASVL
jgi:hypothetical protein